MVIYKAKNYQDLSRKAANIISAQIIMKPDCVLGLATGSSPIGTYKQVGVHKIAVALVIVAGTDTSASMNQEMPLKKKPIVWI